VAVRFFPHPVAGDKNVLVANGFGSAEVVNRTQAITLRGWSMQSPAPAHSNTLDPAAHRGAAHATTQQDAMAKERSL